jgi:Flp pilus assembly protein TadB
MSRRSRRLNWSPLPQRPPPKHQIRDTAILYGVLCVVLVVIAWAAGTSVLRAAVLAIGVFVLAVGWSSLNWRRRMRDQAEDFPR